MSAAQRNLIESVLTCTDPVWSPPFPPNSPAAAAFEAALDALNWDVGSVLPGAVKALETKFKNAMPLAHMYQARNHLAFNLLAAQSKRLDGLKMSRVFRSTVVFGSRIVGDGYESPQHTAKTLEKKCKPVDLAHLSLVTMDAVRITLEMGFGSKDRPPVKGALDKRPLNILTTFFLESVR